MVSKDQLRLATTEETHATDEIAKDARLTGRAAKEWAYTDVTPKPGEKMPAENSTDESEKEQQEVPQGSVPSREPVKKEIEDKKIKALEETIRKMVIYDKRLRKMKAESARAQTEVTSNAVMSPYIVPEGN